MAAASDAMYKHLWIPKRTARDWGKTDYHVIRNWTPRVAQAASDHHTLDHTTPEHTPEPNDIMDQGPVGQVAEESGVTVPSSLGSLQRGGGSGTQSEEDVDDGGPQLVSTGRKRVRSSARSSDSVAKRHRVSLNVDSGSVGAVGEQGGEGERGREGERGGEGAWGGEGERREAEKDVHSLDGTAELSAVRAGMLEGRRLRKTRATAEQQTSASERRSIVSEPVRLGGRERGEKADDGRYGEVDSEPGEEDEGTAKTARRKRNKGTSQTAVFKLWQSHYHRDGRDLNELDICFSLYDSVMRDGINEEADTPIVQRALIEHWKLTKKHILSTIRDLAIVSALEKKQRQEVTKYRKLQKESLAALKSLRQINGQYLQAVSRARSSRQAHKLSVEQSEVEELSRELAAYVAKLKCNPH